MQVTSIQNWVDRCNSVEFFYADDKTARASRFVTMQSLLDIQEAHGSSLSLIDVKLVKLPASESLKITCTQSQRRDRKPDSCFV